jgi:hypothetical protein
MPLYFLLLDRRLFHEQIAPALAASWRQRSFLPCRPLCAALEPAARAFGQRYHDEAAEPLLCQVGRGLSFGRDRWRHLAGEVLFYAAAEIPEIQTAQDTLGHLLGAAPASISRSELPPIHQAHQGTRDLCFGGGFYRPEHAGYNDTDDVARLVAEFGRVDPGRWDVTALPATTDEDERGEELEFARECFTALRDLYRRAQDAGQVIVCETL